MMQQQNQSETGNFLPVSFCLLYFRVEREKHNWHQFLEEARGRQKKQISTGWPTICCLHMVACFPIETTVCERISERKAWTLSEFLVCICTFFSLEAKFKQRQSITIIVFCILQYGFTFWYTSFLAFSKKTNQGKIKQKLTYRKMFL